MHGKIVFACCVGMTSLAVLCLWVLSSQSGETHIATHSCATVSAEVAERDLDDTFDLRNRVVIALSPSESRSKLSVYRLDIEPPLERWSLSEFLRATDRLGSSTPLAGSPAEIPVSFIPGARLFVLQSIEDQLSSSLGPRRRAAIIELPSINPRRLSVQLEESISLKLRVENGPRETEPKLALMSSDGSLASKLCGTQKSVSLSVSVDQLLSVPELSVRETVVGGKLTWCTLSSADFLFDEHSCNLAKRRFEERLRLRRARLDQIDWAPPCNRRVDATITSGAQGGLIVQTTLDLQDQDEIVFPVIRSSRWSAHLSTWPTTDFASFDYSEQVGPYELCVDRGLFVLLGEPVPGTSDHIPVISDRRFLSMHNAKSFDEKRNCWFFQESIRDIQALKMSEEVRVENPFGTRREFSAAAIGTCPVGISVVSIDPASQLEGATIVQVQTPKPDQRTGLRIGYADQPWNRCWTHVDLNGRAIFWNRAVHPCELQISHEGFEIVDARLRHRGSSRIIDLELGHSDALRMELTSQTLGNRGLLATVDFDEGVQRKTSLQVGGRRALKWPPGAKTATIRVSQHNNSPAILTRTVERGAIERLGVVALPVSSSYVVMDLELIDFKGQLASDLVVLNDRDEILMKADTPLHGRMSNFNGHGRVIARRGQRLRVRLTGHHEKELSVEPGSRRLLFVRQD